MNKIKFLRLCVFASMLLFAACSGLAGEPKIVTTLVPPTLAPTEAGHPLVIPDLALGATVYAANCVRCHGISGAGDGEFALSGQVQNVASFQDPTTAFNQNPTDWFQTITNGRIENLMPPWKDALSFDERWAVAMYTYTLSYTPEQIARGQELYKSECAECHGETGRGDGPKAAELNDSPGDLSDFAGMVALDDQAIYVDINEGVGDLMPARGMQFGGDWSDADVHAAVAYVRTLSLAKTDTIGKTTSESAAEQVADPVATEEVSAASADATALPADTTPSANVPTQVRVIGQISNGTATGTLPDGLSVTLFAIKSQTEYQQYSATSAADGSFTFENVPYTPTGLFVATVDYRDRVFASEQLTGDDLAAQASSGVLDLPITIYELTDDPSVIEISGMVSRITVVGDGIQIAQVFNVHNTADRAFTSTQLTDDGRPISLIMPLPPGAVVLSIGGGDNRFIVPEDNSVVIDTEMVLPDEDHVVSVVYLIQYGGGAIIEQPVNYTVNGAVRLLVSPVDIGIISDQLPPRGQEIVGSGTFASYGADLALHAGDTIRYELSGAAASPNDINSVTGAVVSGSSLPVIIGIILVLIGSLGIAFYIITTRNQAARREGADPLQSQIDALAAAIAQLDTDYAAGSVDQADYQTQRAALKARMARLIAQRGS